MYEILLLIFIIILFIFILNSNNFYKKQPIDIVFTWVKVDPEFEKEKEYWSRQLNIKYNMNNRFQDHQELKYSLRSIVKYFPKFRYIYIIVRDGQIPEYLKKSHPRLKFINHSKIIPSKFLPTFSSLVIEQYLHHIPGLSQYYIYLNDDMMFINQVDPQYFFNKNGKIYATKGPIFDKRISKLDLQQYKNSYDFLNNLAWNNYILDKIHVYEKNRYNIQHVPKMYNRKLDFDMEKRLKNIICDILRDNIFDHTSKNKFRKNTDLALNAFIKHYLYKYWYNKCDFKKYDELYLSLEKDELEQILTSDRLFLCVNDTLNYDDKDKAQKIIENLKDILELKFPNKSPFEK